MTSAAAFSLTFLEAHPADAARVLEELTPASAAGFAEQAPPALLAPALAQMPPARAANILARSSAKITAETLIEMSPHARTTLLRALPPAARDKALTALPRREAAALRRYLAYDPGTVGAWMRVPKATLATDRTVAQSLERLRKLREPPGQRLFVTGQNAQLVGHVELDALLVADDDALVGSLLQKEITTLSPYAPLATVVQMEAWDTSLLMPVTDRSERLLGVLTFDNVRNGLVTDRDSGDRPQGSAMLFHLGEALVVSLTGLLQTASAPPARIGGDAA